MLTAATFESFEACDDACVSRTTAAREVLPPPPHNACDWQFMPVADSGTAKKTTQRLLLHALYLGAASGYQPRDDQVHIRIIK